MKSIAVVGLGLIGKERVRAVELLKTRGLDVRMVGVHDPAPGAAQFAHEHGIRFLKSVEEVKATQPDLAIVSVPHDAAAVIASGFLRDGLKVLVEKPFGRSYAEAQQATSQRQYIGQISIGCNYRFFPGIIKLAEDLKTGTFGKPIGMSMVLGHGGRPTDKTSWKHDPKQVSGGALSEPGIHLFDLASHLGEELEFVAGTTWQGFWQCGFEEECHLLFRGSHVPSIDMTSSLVRWRSTFRVEIFGEDGYGIVNGRGRSYGLQQYKRGKRWAWQSASSQIESEELVVETDCDSSFADEIEAVLFGCRDGQPHPCSAEESLHNMSLLDQVRTALGVALPSATGSQFVARD